jgi:hypothetical protein
MPTIPSYRTEGDRLAEHWGVRDEVGAMGRPGGSQLDLRRVFLAVLFLAAVFFAAEGVKASNHESIICFCALFCAAFVCAVAWPRAVFADLFQALRAALIHGFLAMGSPIYLDISTMFILGGSAPLIRWNWSGLHSRGYPLEKQPTQWPEGEP